jgi:conjugative relaxase-like TrwC/TraI family protein
VAGLFADDRLADAFRGVASASDRRPFTRSLDPRVATRLAEPVGLDPVEVYRGEDGADVFGAALERAADRYDARNAAYDVCVSAPKSVSTLWALADPEVAAAVESAHTEAVTTAIRYLERTCGYGLRGHQGDGQRAARIDTDGLVAAAFAHRTSRANDPQLHTHVVIANLLCGKDGKWSALDSRALFRQATTASYIYHAVLRGELSKTLGVGWTSVTKGIAEIAGIPSGLAHEFSTRRNEIENYLGASGRDDPSAMQHACLATRPNKTGHSSGELRVDWQQTARRLGHDAAKVVRDVVHRGPVAEVEMARLVATLTGPGGLTRHKTAVDQRDVIQALCDALPAGTPVNLSVLDRLTRDIVDDPGVIPLLHGSRATGPTYSTTELVATEQRALAIAAELRGSQPGYTSGQLPLRGGLTEEQHRLALRLVFPDSRLDVIVGPAGSGKTSALASAYRVWRADQIPVVGTAVAALAARGLQSRTGIPSVTLTQLLADLDRVDPRTRRPAGFAPGTVVVVDEASMVDSRTHARLLEHVSRCGARLTLVGDTEQLPEIEAGGLFATLAADPSTICLAANVRQPDTWERDALTALRQNRPAAALLAYLEHERIHVDEAHRLPAALTSAYVDSTSTGPLGTVALASTRREVAALNAAIRARLVREGLIDPSAVATSSDGTLEVAAGDVIVVTRNHREHGVLNGMRGHVISFDPRAASVAMVDDLGESHLLPAELLASGDVQHGYALTIHRAQGVTVDTALVYGTSALTKEAGYVALSRGRIANHLFASPDDLREAALRHPFDADASDLFAAVEQLSTRLAVSRRQQLATSYLPHPAPPERKHAFLPPAREMRGVSR